MALPKSILIPLDTVYYITEYLMALDDPEAKMYADELREKLARVVAREEYAQRLRNERDAELDAYFAALDANEKKEG